MDIWVEEAAGGVGSELLYGWAKSWGKIDGGVCSRELSINISFRLPDYCRVFQTEVDAVKVVVDLFFLQRS